MDSVLIFSARAFGLRNSDVLKLILKGPDGAPLAVTERPMVRTRALAFAYIGKRRPTEGWATGRYVAEVEIIRSGGQPDRALITRVVE